MASALGFSFAGCEAFAPATTVIETTAAPEITAPKITTAPRLQQELLSCIHHLLNQG